MTTSPGETCWTGTRRGTAALDVGDLAQGDEDLAAEAGVGDLEAAHGRAAALLVEEGGGAVGGLHGGELGLGLVELGVE